MEEKNDYAGKMLIWILIIILGTISILYLSTLGENTLHQKIEFYSSKIGQLVTMMIFFLSAIPVYLYIKSDESSGRGLIYRILILVSVQAIILSIAPFFSDFFMSLGEGLEQYIKEIKKLK